MAIQTQGELVVVLTDVILKIDRTLSEQSHNPTLSTAARDLKLLAEHLKKGAKPTPQHIKSLLSASSIVRDTMKSEEMYDRMLDIEDFVQSMP